jgi:hypothetical protein
MIFTNVPPTGSVRITGLQNTGAYDYYMKLYKNGWCRKSATKTLFKGAVSVTPTSLLLEPSIAHYLTAPLGFDVSSNGTWDVSFGPVTPPTWIINVSTYINPITFDGSIRFGFTTNTGPTRNALMKVTALGGTYQIIPISQVGAITNVTLNISPVSDNYATITCGGMWDSSQNITLTGLPSDTSVNIQFVEKLTGYSTCANNVDYNASMQFKKNLSSYPLNLNGSISSGSVDVSTSTIITNIGSSDILAFKVPAFGIFAQEDNTPCDGNWKLYFEYSIYVTYVSGSPINVLNNGAGYTYSVPYP